MNTTERFSGRAGVYQASRPGYPAALSEHLASLGMRGARVADIGAGTGIFSRLLLELGCTVFQGYLYSPAVPLEELLFYSPPREGNA